MNKETSSAKQYLCVLPLLDLHDLYLLASAYVLLQNSNKRREKWDILWVAHVICHDNAGFPGCLD